MNNIVAGLLFLVSFTGAASAADDYWDRVDFLTRTEQDELNTLDRAGATLEFVTDVSLSEGQRRQKVGSDLFGKSECALKRTSRFGNELEIPKGTRFSIEHVRRYFDGSWTSNGGNIYCRTGEFTSYYMTFTEDPDLKMICTTAPGGGGRTYFTISHVNRLLKKMKIVY